jgi:hypothetical protein
MAGDGAQPDPVSVTFEDIAARLLKRVYDAPPDEWVMTLVYDPRSAHVLSWARWGIDVTGPDTVRGRKAKTRWLRAYVRAVYRLNKEGKNRPLQFEAGRHRQALGARPAGTALRVRKRPGGKAAKRGEGDRRPPGQRWSYGGEQWADPSERDWT